MPVERSSVELFPRWLQEIVYRVVPRVAPVTWPVARHYLDITGTRQHWTLFAPWPANWKSSVMVAPFFPEEGHSDRWRVDTLVVEGPYERPYPHVLDHRTFRILYNLGYENSGTVYRPYFAREMCRTLRTDAGVAPDGVSLMIDWWLMSAPWLGEGDEYYRQWLGGFDCQEEDQGPGPAKRRWTAYGLPATMDVSGWSVAEWPDSASVADDRPGRPPS